mgnify:CR=1 FL=1
MLYISKFMSKKNSSKTKIEEMKNRFSSKTNKNLSLDNQVYYKKIEEFIYHFCSMINIT